MVFARFISAFLLCFSLIMPSMAAGQGHHALIQKAFGQAGHGDLREAIHTLWYVPTSSPDYARAQGKIKEWQSTLLQAAQAQARRTAAAAPAAESANNYTVWVNSRTGVYHNSGCRWYGNTHSGYYAKVNSAPGRPCGKCGG